MARKAGSWTNKEKAPERDEGPWLNLATVGVIASIAAFFIQPLLLILLIPATVITFILFLKKS